MADALYTTAEGRTPPLLRQALRGVLINHEAVVPEIDFLGLSICIGLERRKQVEEFVEPGMGEEDIGVAHQSACGVVLEKE